MQVILSCGALLWGMWLLLPFRTFASSPATYALLEHTACEWVWGLALMSLSLGSLYTVLRANLRWQRRLLLALTAWWLLLVILFSTGNLASTATPGYLLLATIHVWAYIEVGVFEKR